MKCESNYLKISIQLKLIIYDNFKFYYYLLFFTHTHIYIGLFMYQSIELLKSPLLNMKKQTSLAHLAIPTYNMLQKFLFVNYMLFQFK